MIRPQDIPPEVVKAASSTHSLMGWRGIIAAALNAWPDAFVTKYSEGAPAFNIPLKENASDR